ncbi:MAG: undecaprenyldiphospho-muramoylpentapeptide beta-N-acetylglucosaminyltransferase [Pseudomonadota bacterium]
MTAPVMIMAGGTGGHVFPALAVAERLRELSTPVVWMGTREGLEARVVPAHGLPIEWVSVSGLRGKGAAGWLLAPFRLVRALVQSLSILLRSKPAVVLGMGGFVTGPGGVAAWLLRTPLVIHEQNAIAGLTNRLLSRLASDVLAGFPNGFPPRANARTVGNPVRRDIAALPAPVERLAGRDGRPRLLVVGGSRGALALNRKVPAALAHLPDNERPSVWHQCGSKTLDEAEAAYAEAGVEARIDAFIDDMPAAYAWADLVVCRAGALTVAELGAVGVAALLVPFPYAVDDHQTANGQHLVAAGAAVLAPEATLDAESLAAALRKLLGDRERLLAMAQKARGTAQPDATEALAQAVLGAVRDE